MIRNSSKFLSVLTDWMLSWKTLNVKCPFTFYISVFVFIHLIELCMFNEKLCYCKVISGRVFNTGWFMRSHCGWGVRKQEASLSLAGWISASVKREEKDCCVRGWPLCAKALQCHTNRKCLYCGRWHVYKYELYNGYPVIFCNKSLQFYKSMHKSDLNPQRQNTCRMRFNQNSFYLQIW